METPVLSALPAAPWWVRHQRPLFACAAGGWLGLIWYASSLPGDAIGTKAPGPTGNLAHIWINAVLGFFVLRVLAPAVSWRVREAWPGLRTAVGARMVLLVWGFGVVDEIHQWFVPNRSTSVVDLLLDAGGACLVLLVPGPPATGRPRAGGPLVLTALALVGLAIWGAGAWGLLPAPPGDDLLHPLLARLLGPKA